jgi:hypothetical protein
VSGFLSAISDLASVNVDCEDGKPFLSENLSSVTDRLVETPPFLDKNNGILRFTTCLSKVGLTILLTFDFE